MRSYLYSKGLELLGSLLITDFDVVFKTLIINLAVLRDTIYCQTCRINDVKYILAMSYHGHRYSSNNSYQNADVFLYHVGK